jgi:polysaccharide export outer membrane protein
MQVVRRWSTWRAWAALLLASSAGAQSPLLEEVRTLSRGPTPFERNFDVAAPGTYRLTLTDLAIPTSFSSLRAAITQGATVSGTLAAPGSVDIALAAAGTYTLRVVGIPAQAAGAGSFGVEVVNVASPAVPLLALADRLENPSAAVPPNRRTVDTTFDVQDAGSYEVTLIDRAFPAALSTLTLAVLRDGDVALAAQLGAAGSTTFDATPGRYRLLVIGESPADTNAGVFAVRVRHATSGTVVHARTEPVGRVRDEATLTLVAGTHDLVVSDLAFPLPLQLAGAFLAAGADELARRATPGSVSFNAPTGAAHLLVLAQSSASMPGSLGIEVRRPGSVVISTVFTAAVEAQGNVPAAFTYVLDITAAGDLRLRLTDFQFPQPFTAMGAAAVQNGTMLASINSAGALNLPAVQAGRLYVVVLAQPAATPAASGLFGIDVAPAAGGAVHLERTQAVGALLAARTVNIANAGQYEAVLTDLGFPAQFGELAMVVTRGSERIGSAFAGGSFPFAATAGDYIVSVIAQPAASAVYGTFALRLAARPPAPTVTLAADTSSVTSGGTAMLTWSATGADSCTATGGWTGARATSGSERTVALTSNTSFALACSGPGGQGNASVTLSVSSAGNGGGSDGGGGRLDLLLIGLLVLAIFARLRWRGMGRTLLGVALILASGAAVAADDAAASPLDAHGYRVQPGDVLMVAVWKERDLQGEILVRPDGGITFPLAGDIAAGGRTVVELAGDVSEKLKRYIPDPVVTVAVKSIGGNRVYVLGKVNRPGEFAFSQPLDVMQALALAGGATAFAAVNDIRILRRDGSRLEAVAFQYADVERGRKLEQNIVLRSGDTVVVP